MEGHAMNDETKDHIAAVMLRHGTPKQVKEALEYASRGNNKMTFQNEVTINKPLCDACTIRENEIAQMKDKLLTVSADRNKHVEQSDCYRQEITALNEVTESLHKEIERLDKELDDAISTARNYLKESRDKDRVKELEPDTSPIKKGETSGGGIVYVSKDQWNILLNMISRKDTQIATLQAEVGLWQRLFVDEKELLDRQINNPCKHTGYESFVCEQCGYPDPRKTIHALRQQISMLIDFIPDGFDMPLGYSTLVGQILNKEKTK
jgi:vacuolar-type H+-ATPase subunit I/STV1